MTAAVTMGAPRESEDADYNSLVSGMRGAHAWPLFTTDATGLYDRFVSLLPESRRQHYRCRACRHFVERSGGLVTIAEDGAARPLLWMPDAPAFFREAVDQVASVVASARVTGVFLSSAALWGLDSNTASKTGITWHHLHVRPTGEMICRASALKTAEQLAAEKSEDRGILCRSLAEFPIETVRQAHTLLTTGGLYRSEKCIGVAKWLLDLHEALAATKHKVRRDNLIWLSAATAPPGFAHVRSTMIGTLLEDLAAGKPFEAIKASFDSKMHPLQYQRPSAAPTDQQLAEAEKVVAKLASAGSLARRFARLDEVVAHAIWTPKRAAPDAPAVGSVFGHLRSDRAPASTIDVPAQTITWDKFNWTVLPSAERIELLVPRTPAAFFAFVTATDPSAPPILQWDTEEHRNPVSWYLYSGGSLGRAWGLSEGSFADLDAITMQPSGWGNELAHQGEGAYLILRGARDTNYEGCGIALFPEILKSDYRAIRAAIEAFSRSQPLSGAEQASACGIALQKSGGGWGHVLRVTAAGARVKYRIDRWD